MVPTEWRVFWHFLRFVPKEDRDAWMRLKVVEGLRNSLREWRRRRYAGDYSIISQTQLYRRAGVHRHTMGRLESWICYDTRVPIDTLLGIARLIDCALVARFVSWPDFIASHRGGAAND